MMKSATVLLNAHEQRAIRAFHERVHVLMKEDVKSMRLFGSRARGDANEQSDIDVLVLVADAPASIRGKIYDLSADIFLEYEVALSPLVMSAAQYDDMKARERLLIHEIERDGIAV